MTTEERYTSKTLSVEALEAELDTLWSDLQRSDSLVRRQAEELKIDVGELLKFQRRDAITVQREGAGLGAAATAILVAFAPVVAKIVKDLWVRVFLPRILRNKGEQALVPKRET